MPGISIWGAWTFYGECRGADEGAVPVTDHAAMVGELKTLKPCPFCGNAAPAIVPVGKLGEVVYCVACGASGPESLPARLRDPALRSASELWNARRSGIP